MSPLWLIGRHEVFSDMHFLRPYKQTIACIVKQGSETRGLRGLVWCTGLATPADLNQVALAAVMRAGREAGPMQLPYLLAAVAAAQHRSQACLACPVLSPHVLLMVEAAVKDSSPALVRVPLSHSYRERSESSI